MDDKPYAGRILWVDLTRGSYRRQELPDSFYQAYLGGMGLAAAVLQEAIPPSADPLGSENVLAFVPGLLTGTPSLFTGRWLVAAKSPPDQDLGRRQLRRVLRSGHQAMQSGWNLHPGSERTPRRPLS
jgi:aldehyde:ferredoxin oxidoreductase